MKTSVLILLFALLAVAVNAGKFKQKHGELKGLQSIFYRLDKRLTNQIAKAKRQINSARVRRNRHHAARRRAHTQLKVARSKRLAAEVRYNSARKTEEQKLRSFRAAHKVYLNSRKNYNRVYKSKTQDIREWDHERSVIEKVRKLLGVNHSKTWKKYRKDGGVKYQGKTHQKHKFRGTHFHQGKKRFQGHVCKKNGKVYKPNQVVVKYGRSRKYVYKCLYGDFKLRKTYRNVCKYKGRAYRNLSTSTRYSGNYKLTYQCKNERFRLKSKVLVKCSYGGRKYSLGSTRSRVSGGYKRYYKCVKGRWSNYKSLKYYSYRCKHVRVYSGTGTRNVKCPSGYALNGIHRNGHDSLAGIDYFNCCTLRGYGNVARHTANWVASFDRKGWSTCSGGYAMTGYQKSHGNNIYNMEHAFCARRNVQMRSCYQENSIVGALDRPGWARCRSGYYIHGMWRNTERGRNAHKLHRIEYFKCCK